MHTSNTPDTEATIDQSMHTIKVQLAETVSFIGIIYRTMVCYYRSRNDSESAAHHSMGDSSQARNSELTAEPVNSSRDGRASFPGTSADTSLFQEHGLASASSRQLVSSQSLLCISFL